MAGTWMAFAKGFAGMRVKKGQLHFSPYLPEQWGGYGFHIKFRGCNLTISASKEAVTIKNESEGNLDLFVFEQPQHLAGNSEISIAIQ